jgi:Protein of unknown function (DUF3363)
MTMPKRARDFTGDAMPGATVEVRAYEDSRGRKLFVACHAVRPPMRRRSPPTGPPGSTGNCSPESPCQIRGGFGPQLRDGMERRVDHLVREGLARRQGQRAAFTRDLIKTLRRRELDAAAAKLADETGLGTDRPEYYRRDLSAAGGARVRPLRHDRRWTWLPVGAPAARP